MFRKVTLIALLIWLVAPWASARASDPNECISQGRRYMFEKTLSGLRLAYRTFDECLKDPSCADCASNDELVFLHSLTRAAMLFIDTNDLAVNDSFLELAEAFGLLVTGDSLDPCGTNPVDVNVLLDLDGCYRIPAGAPDLDGLGATLDYSIIPEIDNIVAELETIADSQAKRFRIFFEPNETGLQKDLEVDYGEVLILKGLLLAFRSALTAQLAYDVYLDINDTRIESLLYDEGICPNDVNSLEPSDFVDLKDPNNPSINEDFLIPYPDLLKVLPTAGYPDVNGAAILAQSAVDLIDAIDYYQQAVAYIIAEDQPPGTDPQADELVYVDPNERRLLDSINGKLTTLRDSLANDTAGTYPLETTRTYEVQEPGSAKIGELVLLYDPLDIEGDDGTLSFTKSGLAPSPWQVEWFAVVDSNKLHVELERFADGQWAGGFLLGAISADSNTVTDATFEYWGPEEGTISGLTALHTGTEIVDGRLDLNPLFGGSDRYPNPVNPRDLLAEFDRNNEPISGTFGHGLGDDPTLGGIFPDMTQELWAMLLDLPVPGLRFEAAFRLPVGARPVSAVLADLNGDGFPDIITANADSDDISVLLSDGDGGFLPEQYYGAGSGPVSVAVGDLNGDRVPDVVVANEDSCEVSVLMGLADGRLQRQNRHAAGIQPSGVAVGDVTGDGIPDVVTSNRGSSNVCVLPGLGNGDLGPPTFVTVGAGPASVALGDLNWDGIQDIVTADEWSDTISVLLARGDGQFDERRSLQAGGGPASAALGDLNNDGALDIVAGNGWSDDVTVALGKGDGNFEDPTSFNTQEGQFSVALGDVNGDGVTDIVTANTWDTQISVLLGVGDGTFGRRSGFDVGDDPHCVLVGDLDADGIPEIVTANGWSDDVSVFVSISTTYGHHPSGPVPAPVDAVRFHFPHSMNAASFTLEEDLAGFVGPEGPIEPDEFLWIDAQTLEIRFAPQYKYGSYRMAIGPQILDGYGREMDADGDALCGESIEDRYVATFTILGHGDLVITSVEVQGHPTAGRKISVSWDVLNEDPDNTIGRGFMDAVYLSADDQWDIDDIHVATVPHSEPLGPQADYHEQVDVVLPGLQPGQYHLVVRTDPGNQIAEPNGEHNNVKASDPVVVDVNRLNVGETLTDAFTSNEPARYYGIEVLEGEDLEIRLDDVDNLGTNELYVSFGRIPSRTIFDYRYQVNFAPDQTLVIPNTRAGTYYAMAYAAGAAGSGQSQFKIAAEYLPIQIRSVEPDKGGNMSPLPLEVRIEGARFRPGATALLRREGYADISATEVKVIDTGAISAKFDLLDAAVGSWNVVVTNPDSNTATFGFEVFEGGNAKFEARLILPDGLGFHIRAVLWIEYANSGDGPMPAPLLKLHGSQNALLTADKSLDGPGLWTDSPPAGLTDTVQVLALGSGEDCAVLNPGDSGRIPVYWRGLKLPWDWARPPIEFRLGVLTAESTAPIDWAQFEKDIKPCDVNESDWSSMFARLKDQVGPTWADYLAAVSENANKRGAFGSRTYQVAALFSDEVKRAYAEEDCVICGRVVLADGGKGLEGVTVTAVSTDAAFVTTAVTGAGGLFAARFVEPGLYELNVEDYVPTEPAYARAIEGADPCCVEIRVRAAGKISGTVSVTDNWMTNLEDVRVSATNAASQVFYGSAERWGNYTIAGLPGGDYTVRAERDSYVPALRENVTVRLAQTTWGVNLALKKGGIIRGTVRAAEDNKPVEGARVVIETADGLSFTATSDGAGQYSLDTVPKGTVTASVGAPGRAQSEKVEIEVAESATTVHDFILARAATIEGVVTDMHGKAVEGAIVVAESEAGYGAAFTNHEGTYLIEGLPGGTYALEASASGYAPRKITDLLVDEGENITGLAIPLVEGKIVHGVLRDSNDATPVSDVQIVFRSNTGLYAVAVSGQDGTFLVNTLEPGVYYLETLAEGRSTTRLMIDVPSTGTIAPLEISVQKGATVSGRILDPATAPVGAAAVVWLTSPDGTAVGSVRTDETGMYLFDSVPDGQYVVTAFHHDYSYAPVALEVWGEDIQVDLIAASEQLSGLVTDKATGLPVAGVKIAAILQEPSLATIPPMTTTTDSFGQYRFDNLLEEDYFVAAKLDSGELGYQVQPITISASHANRVDFELSEGITLTGVVATIAAEPVPNAVIRIAPTANDRPILALVTTTDANGAYAVRGLSAGQHSMRVQADGYVATAENITVASDMVHNIELGTEGYVLSGVARDATSGLPLCNVHIELTDQEYPVGYCRTDSNGLFAISPLRAGDYKVTAVAQYLRISAEVTLEGDTWLILEGAFQDIPPVTAASATMLATSPDFAASGASMSATSGLMGLKGNLWCPLPPSMSNWCRLIETPQKDPWQVTRRPPLPPDECRCQAQWQRLIQAIDYADVQFLNWQNARTALRRTVLINSLLIGVRGVQVACDIVKLAVSIATAGGSSWAEQLSDISQWQELLKDGPGLCLTIGEAIRSLVIGIRSAQGPANWAAMLRDAGFNTAKLLEKVNKLKPLVKWCGPLGDLISLIEHTLAMGADVREGAQRIREDFTSDIKAEKGYHEWVDAGVQRLVALNRCIQNCQQEPDPNTDPIDGGDANSVGSFDPNKKLGPRGFGAGRYVQPGASMVYTVQFENEPNATGAAKKVRIVDQLDQDLDWTSFELLEIGFGPHNLAVPKGATHHRTKMMVDGWTYRTGHGWSQDAVPMILEVQADLDIETGRAVWEITAYDPETGWEPQDPYAGFLPPDDQDDVTHRGEGYVRFLIRAKDNLPVGTQIRNSASIIFDFNPPIETPETINTILMDRADLDLSGSVDLRDVRLLVNQWLWVGPPGAIDQDIAPDGVVNFADFAELAETCMK